MKKLSIELPKYRLQIAMHLVKRRKPLLPPDPLIPTQKVVNKKYHSGSKLGRIVRYLSEHKLTRKIFAANTAVIFMAMAFIPQTTTEAFDVEQPESVIQIQNTLKTERAIQYPLDKFKINQGFNKFHYAVDLGAPVGSIIKPVKAGVVQFAGYRKDGYGVLIIIDHGMGLNSYYAHLNKVYVSEGQEVDTNMVIGEVGLTGHTTGPHLHLEIHQGTSSLNPLSVLSR